MLFVLSAMVLVLGVEPELEPALDLVLALAMTEVPAKLVPSVLVAEVQAVKVQVDMSNSNMTPLVEVAVMSVVAVVPPGRE